jgi:hypothetical protein
MYLSGRRSAPTTPCNQKVRMINAHWSCCAEQYISWRPCCMRLCPIAHAWQYYILTQPIAVLCTCMAWNLTELEVLWCLAQCRQLLVHSLLGPRAADKKSCLRFSSKVERSSQDMKDASKRRGRMQMDVGYRMQDAGSKGKVWCKGNMEVKACRCVLALNPVNLIMVCNSYYF